MTKNKNIEETKVKTPKPKTKSKKDVGISLSPSAKGKAKTEASKKPKNTRQPKEQDRSTYKLTKPERETHFYIDEVDEMWTADTTILKDMNRLTKQGWTVKNTSYYHDGKVSGMTFKAPRHAISIGKAEKKKRVLTEKQKIAQAERIKNMHEAKRLKEEADKLEQEALKTEDKE